MKKFLLLFFTFTLSLLAYKDSYYFGIFKSDFTGDGDVHPSYLDETLTYPKENFDIEGDGYGIRFGLESNENKEHTAKQRLEVSYENKDLLYKNNRDYKTKGNRVAVSAYYGKDLDIFLTDEFILFGKVSFGYSDLDSLGKATDLAFGVNAVYASKFFEVQLGVDREFRGWGSHVLIPYDYFDPKNHHEVTDNFYGGINIRF